MQIWSVNYSLHFGSVKINKHCLYWKVFSTNIYSKIFFNRLLLFKLYLLVSKLYELSQQMPQLFSNMLGRFIFEGFKYCPLWKVNFQLSNTFLAFFIWSVNCSRDFFSHFVSQQMVWVESLNHVTYLGDVQKLKH